MEFRFLEECPSSFGELNLPFEHIKKARSVKKELEIKILLVERTKHL